nr:class I SAM-dependent methyltransferase [Rhodospirillales bacterium]
MENIDKKTVDDFGDEWSAFSHENLSNQILQQQFDRYFEIFNWKKLPENAKGFDMGCGSGRWAKLVAPLVGELYCIDASEKALEVAKNNLKTFNNCKFHVASFESIPLEDNTMDFGYSLGVLHHIPDTLSGIQDCVKKLKQGAPFLAYIYYAFDNKPLWFKWVWKLSDIFRRIISSLPFGLKWVVSQMISILIYYPLARTSLLIEVIFKFNVDNIPLSAYRKLPFYSMRTDALDRFGTKLEKRFTKNEISKMFMQAGLEEVVFNKDIPYWCVIGYKTDKKIHNESSRRRP